MVTCSFCLTEHVVNTIYCGECGHYLLEDDKRETDPLETQKKGWVGEVQNRPARRSSLQIDLYPVAIRLKIGLKKREFEIPLSRSVHLGRVDPALDVFPEIDLTHENDLSKSVSRRHATILRQGDSVLVEDTGSVNGTFINGKRLDPYLPEVINSGDILQLGKLQVEVEIVKQRV